MLHSSCTSCSVSILTISPDTYRTETLWVKGTETCTSSSHICILSSELVKGTLPMPTTTSFRK